MCDCSYTINGSYVCPSVPCKHPTSNLKVKETFADPLNSCPSGCTTSSYDINRPYTIYSQVPQKIVTQYPPQYSMQAQQTPMFFAPKNASVALTSQYPSGSSVCPPDSSCFPSPATPLAPEGIRYVQDFTLGLSKPEQQDIQTFCYYAMQTLNK